MNMKKKKKKPRLDKIDKEIYAILKGKNINRESKLKDELQDVVNSIDKFAKLNRKRDLAIVGSIVIFNEEGEVEPKENIMFAFGDKEVLRSILNELRDRIEDQADSNDFVDF